MVTPAGRSTDWPAAESELRLFVQARPLPVPVLYRRPSSAIGGRHEPMSFRENFMGYFSAGRRWWQQRQQQQWRLMEINACYPFLLFLENWMQMRSLDDDDDDDERGAADYLVTRKFACPVLCAALFSRLCRGSGNAPAICIVVFRAS